MRSFRNAAAKDIITVCAAAHVPKMDFNQAYRNPSSEGLAGALKQAGGWTVEDMENPDRSDQRALHRAEISHEVREARMAGSPSPSRDAPPMDKALAFKIGKHIKEETRQGIGNTDWHGDRTLCTQDGRFHPGKQWPSPSSAPTLLAK